MAMLESEATSHGWTCMLSKLSLSCFGMLGFEAGLDFAEIGAFVLALILDNVFSGSRERATFSDPSVNEILLFFLGLTSTKSSSGPDATLESSEFDDVKLDLKDLDGDIIRWK
jgi:hypothetical protein